MPPAMAKSASPRPAKRAASKTPAPLGPPVAQVSTQGGPFPDVSTAVVKRRAQKMLAHLELAGVELSVALVDDATIHELNRGYRHKNKPTDVLAFALHEPEDGRLGLKARVALVRERLAGGGLAGDVIVSIETARRQAAEHRRPLLDELTMLLAHGLLHLLGYDHRTDAEEREMTARTGELETAAITRAPRV